jgi:hypothetical protein
MRKKGKFFLPTASPSFFVSSPPLDLKKNYLFIMVYVVV